MRERSRVSVLEFGVPIKIYNGQLDKLMWCSEAVSELEI